MNKKKKLQVEEQSEEQMMVSETPDAGEEFGATTVQRGKTSRVFFAIAVIVLIAAAVYFAAQKWGNVFVVASVNGQPLTRLQLWQRLEKRAGQQTLDEMINEALVEQEAVKKNLTVSQKEIDTKVADLEKRFKGKDGLNQMLSLQGMTRDDLVSQIKLQVLVEKMVPQQKVSEAEINDYYEKNKETYGEELTADVKSQIKNQLLQEKTSKAFSDWFDKLKKGAKVSKYL